MQAAYEQHVEGKMPDCVHASSFSSSSCSIGVDANSYANSFDRHVHSVPTNSVSSNTCLTNTPLTRGQSTAPAARSRSPQRLCRNLNAACHVEHRSALLFADPSGPLHCLQQIPAAIAATSAFSRIHEQAHQHVQHGAHDSKTHIVLPSNVSCEGISSLLSQPRDDQDYNPSFDTLARYPPTGGGYSLGAEHDSQQQPHFGKPADAFSQMHFDIKALTQHGAALGIDSDPLRAAHAYHNYLETVFAESSAATTSYPSCPLQPLDVSSHLQAIDATLPSAPGSSLSCTHAPPAPAKMPPKPAISQFEEELQRQGPVPLSATDCRTPAAIPVTSCLPLNSSCALRHSGVPDLPSEHVGAPSFLHTDVNPRGNDVVVGRPAKRYRLS